MAAVLGKAAVVGRARHPLQLGLLRRGCAGVAVDDTVNGLSEEQRQVQRRRP